MTAPNLVDPRGARFGQGATALLAAAALALGSPALAGAAAVPLAWGSIVGPRGNPWALAWSAVVRALRLAPPRTLKVAGPLRFAQTLGWVFLAAGAALALAPGAWAAAGWALVAAVAALAALAAVADFCVGCWIYEGLARLRRAGAAL